MEAKVTGKIRINCFKYESGCRKPTLVNWYITNHYSDGLIDPPAFEKHHGNKRRAIKRNTGGQTYYEEADFNFDCTNY